MFLSTAALCVALNVYFEARGESLTGQHAVAQVTMNRAGRDPNKVCKAVFDPKQFSWANPLTGSKGAERVRLAKGFVPKDEKAWALARSIAFQTIKGNIRDFTKGATFYHAKSAHPQWSRQVTLVAVIGQHKFYRA